ncbi:MAG: ABC transporter ATP-binding protein/permease [Muribaculum sp.]|nr:ABC transporter ATP-binding protein/permease [Muribaculum sp.]
MLKYLKKYWHFCLLAPLFMIGEIAMDLIQPDMMAAIVDEGVLKMNQEVVLTEGLRMILFVFLGGLSGVLCGIFANLAAQRFGNDLRKELFAKIMSLSFEQTDHFSTGSLITRLVSDVTQVQQMAAMSMRGLVRNSVMFAGGVFMLYRQSPRFALVAACGLPFILFFVVFFLKKASPMFVVVQQKLDEVNNRVQETLTGTRVVKAYVREEQELQRFDAANDALCGINLKVQTLLAFMTPCMNIVLNLCVVAILYVGGYTMRTTGGLSSGRIMAAVTYMAMILHGITFMANIFQTFTRAKASADRINEVLHCADKLPDGCCEPPVETGELEFRHVSFAYPEGSNVLEDIQLTVHKGETLGIIGATGSGKSTLVNLIPRFYDATKGQVLIDGMDVKDFPLRKLRERVAIVMQKAELYSRSIEANIRWGRAEASLWEIKNAAVAAQADDFICRTKDGYYTMVTEGGHSLSGGQKQRLSISRAILKNASILIFDDTTNALDLQTESRLYQALRQACPHAAKVIVAQRIASVQNADRIAVLDGGRIAACGTHEQLLAESEIYRAIYDSQLKQ